MIFFSTIKSFLKDKQYRDLIATVTAILAIGTVVYHFLEGWTWLDSFYFSFITLTTIGFGDFAPKTDEGKVFTIIYIIIGVGIILSFINTLYHHYSSAINNRKSGREISKPFDTRPGQSGNDESEQELP